MISTDRSRESYGFNYTTTVKIGIDQRDVCNTMMTEATNIMISS